MREGTRDSDSDRWLGGAGKLVVLALLAVAAPGCRADGAPVAVTGRIAADAIHVQVPMLAVPSPALEISAGGDDAGGIGGAASAARRSSSSKAASLAGLGSVAVVASVPVEPGARVRAGDVLVRFDDRALRVGVEAARAAERVARARVGVLEDLDDDLADRRATLADTRSELRRTIPELEATLADLRGRRRLAAARLAQLRSLLGSLPSMSPGSSPGSTPPGSTPPTGTPPPGGGGAQPPDPARIRAGVARLENAIAQLDAAIGQLESGLARARSGLARLESAAGDLSDASATVDDALELARIGAKGASIPVALAREQLSAATILAPVDGVVLDAPAVGDTLAPGAIAVALRPPSAASAEAWLGFDDLARVAVGDPATVRLDSLPGRRFEARIASIGRRAQYPPTFAATRDVHLGRAVLVELEIVGEDAPVLPAGTPCDIVIGGSGERGSGGRRGGVLGSGGRDDGRSAR